jgi:tetratricopeptide (TPR) repeat protein
VEAKDILTISLSSAALTVSLATVVINLLQKRGETTRTLRQQLTEVVGKLNGVFDANNQLRTEHVEDWESTVVLGIRSTLNGQKLLYARQIVYLIGQIPKWVTEIDYNCLGRAFWDNGDYTEATAYFRKAMSAATHPRYKAVNQRGLGRLLFETGQFDEARRSLREVVDAASNFDGAPDHHFAGETLHRWALSERDFGDQAMANKLFTEAEAAYSQDVNIPRRASSLRALKKAFGRE